MKKRAIIQWLKKYWAMVVLTLGYGAIFIGLGFEVGKFEDGYVFTWEIFIFGAVFSYVVPVWAAWNTWGREN